MILRSARDVDYSANCGYEFGHRPFHSTRLVPPQTHRGGVRTTTHTRKIIVSRFAVEDAVRSRTVRPGVDGVAGNWRADPA